MAKVETDNITSYDLLKFLAIVLMIVDHIGFYFYPDEFWLRAVGRLSAPIWLFLIGYARGRDLMPLLIGTVILTLSSMAVGQAVLPFPILATMIAARLMLDPLMSHLVRQKDPFAALIVTAAVFLFLSIVTAPLMDYGTGGLLFVIAGYMSRNRDALPYRKSERTIFSIIAPLFYAAMTLMLFFPSFDIFQKSFTVAGLVALSLSLNAFRPKEYPSLTKTLPAPIVALLQFGGRHSLIIFVGHLVLFKALALYLGVPGYNLFNIRWY